MKFEELIAVLNDESRKIRKAFTRYKLQITVDGVTHIIPSNKVQIRVTPSYITPEIEICCWLSEEFGHRKICFTSGIYCAQLKPELIMENESDSARWYVAKNGDCVDEWYTPNGERIVTVNGVAQDKTFNELLYYYDNKTDA